MYFLDTIKQNQNSEELRKQFKNTKSHQRARFIYSQKKINDEVTEVFDPNKKINIFSKSYLKALVSRTKTEKLIAIIEDGISCYIESKDNEMIKEQCENIIAKIKELEDHISSAYDIHDKEDIFFIITNLYSHEYRIEKRKSNHHKDIFVIQPEARFLEDPICRDKIKEIIAAAKECDKRCFNIDHFFAGFNAYFLQKKIGATAKKLLMVLFLSKIFGGVNIFKFDKIDPLFLSYRYVLGGDIIQDLFFYQFDFSVNQIYSDIIVLETIKTYHEKDSEITQNLRNFSKKFIETKSYQEIPADTYLQDFFKEKNVGNLRFIAMKKLYRCIQGLYKKGLECR